MVPTYHLVCRLPCICTGTNLRFPHYVEGRSEGESMPTAAEYQQYAAECLHALKLATNPDVRAALGRAAPSRDRG
jgi:hypothetical protein